MRPPSRSATRRPSRPTSCCPTAPRPTSARSGPTTAPLILDFHARQSPQSIYYRYFSPRPRLSRRGTSSGSRNVDYVDRFALVALRGDELIGVARYDRWRHRSEAEVAFFVDDANHGRGLATRAARAPRRARRARSGSRGFTASVLPENRKMIGVFTPGRLRDGHPASPTASSRCGSACSRRPRRRPRSTSGPGRRPPRRCGGCCRPAASRSSAPAARPAPIGHDVLQQPAAGRVRRARCGR